MLPEPANPLEVRMARLEESFEQIDKRLDRVEARFSRVAAKMESLRNLIFILFGAPAGLVTVFEIVR